MSSRDANFNVLQKASTSTAEAPKIENHPPFNSEFENCKHRGIALIFNHQYFLNGRKTRRTSTNKDRDRLVKVLESLHFNVVVYDDFTLKEIKRVLKKGKKYLSLLSLIVKIFKFFHSCCHGSQRQRLSFGRSDVAWYRTVPFQLRSGLWGHENHQILHR